MAKIVASEGVIKSLLSEGWKLRVRKRGGKKYLSARKGQVEKGLGLYTIEVSGWIDDFNKYQKLYAETQSKERTFVQKSSDQLTWVLEDVQELLLKNKVKGCLNHNAYGFCDYWKLTALPVSANGIDQSELDKYFMNISSNSDSETWLIKVDPKICYGCAAYIDLDMVKKLQSLLLK